MLNTLLTAETMLVNSASEWKNCEFHVVGTQKEIESYSELFEKASYAVHHIYNENFFKQHHAAIPKGVRIRCSFMCTEKVRNATMNWTQK